MNTVRISVALIICLLGALSAQAAQVQGVRVWASPDGTRLVLDTDAPVEHKVFLLENPHRVVIDIADARLGGDLGGIDFTGSLLHGIRSAEQKDGTLRMVLDASTAVRPKSFALKPNQRYGHRLVLDLTESANRGPAPIVARAAPPAAATPATARSAPAVAEPRELVIAIDAGHGGEDPGALGPKGQREKDLVLAIARRLEALVRNEPGMRPVMIRDGDYYISLRDRMQKARQSGADLFISIHADAFHDRRAHGSSVYVLSQRGASSEAARFLADSENSADLIGGVSLEDKDDVVASILIDLTQDATIAASIGVGDVVLNQLRDIGKLHKARVEQAGFMVLKAPDVPSILVETGFISNPGEERKLADRHYQQKLALAMMTGVREYFTRNPPEGTQFAHRERRHVAQRGDTLSGIAQRYRVSTDRLRLANGLDGDAVHVGQELRIPLQNDG